MTSVLEHRFGSGDPYTLGVEEEYMLLHPATWDLVPDIDSLLAAAKESAIKVHRLQPRADPMPKKPLDVFKVRAIAVL